MHDSTRTRGKAVGEVIEEQTWHTVAGAPLTVPTAAPVTHIQFRRFAGCPVCSLHLRSFIARRDELTSAGVREVVVFHSTADALREHEGHLPFDVVPDPDKWLYRRFGVESSKLALLHPRAWGTVLVAIARRSILVLQGKHALPPLNPPGGRFGLPADFVIDSSGRLAAVHYGRRADDQMSVDEVLAAARAITARSKS